MMTNEKVIIFLMLELYEEYTATNNLYPDKSKEYLQLAEVVKRLVEKYVMYEDRGKLISCIETEWGNEYTPKTTTHYQRARELREETLKDAGLLDE